MGAFYTTLTSVRGTTPEFLACTEAKYQSACLVAHFRVIDSCPSAMSILFMISYVNIMRFSGALLPFGFLSFLISV